MIKYVETQVTFSEIPDEITLCINLSNCPHKCKDCHSPYLQEDVGEELTVNRLQELIDNNKGITCVCFMGGDCDIPQLLTLAESVKSRKDFTYKVGWYSGLEFQPMWDRPSAVVFDYIKTGPYMQDRGPLNSPTTNQRMWKKTGIIWENITYKFWRNESNKTKTQTL